MANDIKGKKPPALPVDGNGRVVAGIVLPIVDGSGHIIGWSPIATSDQGDGTLAIKVDTDIIIDDPTIILGNVKVGSTDQTSANTRWLKVDSDGTAHITEGGASSSAVMAVARSATSVTLLASNANRRGATVYNDTGANLFLKLGATATTTTSFTVRLGSQDYYEVPAKYIGVIDGIWASGGGGNALVTELT